MFFFCAISETEKERLTKFSEHVEDVTKGLVEIKDQGTEILDRPSDQTKIHNALQFIDNYGTKMENVFKKFKVKNIIPKIFQR